MEETQLDSADLRNRKGFGRLLNSFRSDRDFTLFLIASLFGGIATGINGTIFNNYLSDVYNLSEAARGSLEIFREAPGLFIMVILGIITFLGDIRIALLGMLAAGLGMLGLGLFSPSFALMIVWMMMFSLGSHMIFPVTPSIGMELSRREEYGARLSKVSAFSLIGAIVAYVLVYLGFNYLHITYQSAFIAAACFFVISACAYAFMKKQKPEVRKIRFVFRKRYTLYYALCLVSGARNQIFMTFAPWVLIKVFGVTPSVFAILGIVVAFVSIGTRKIVGKTIDIKGERLVLTIEAALLFVICLGYAFSASIFTAGVAVVVIAACYIIDNSMSAVEMARSTYIKKIAQDPSDVTPTLSTGVSIQHVASMTAPVLGGLLWAAMGQAEGYKYVFMAAAVIAILNLILSSRIKV